MSLALSCERSSFDIPKLNFEKRDSISLKILKRNDKLNKLSTLDGLVGWLKDVKT